MTALIAALVSLFIAIEAWQRLLTPAGKAQLKLYLAQWFGSLIETSQVILTAVEGELQPIVAAFTAAFSSSGGAILNTVRAPVADFVATEFAAAAGGLTSQGESTPDNAVGTAANAMADAFGFGIASAAVTAAFEAAFPEKLNTLNGVGPMLAEMAGFEEIAKAVREPLYKNAFGRSLDYHYRSTFKPELPREQDAVLWHARRLLTDDQLRVLFDFSGLKAEYEAPFITSAYRSVQPRAIASAIQDTPFPRAEMQSLLEFGGFRDQDIALLLNVFETNSLKNVRQAFMQSAVKAAERGNISEGELDSDLDQLGFSAEAKNFVHLTVANTRLEQLAELYRKSVDEAYKFGLITDADYVPNLEAIGIAAADAQAHYAIVSFAKQGRALLAEERALAIAARQQEHAAVAAAIADYAAGNVNETVLATALAAAGMAPIVIPYVVAYQHTRRDARRRNVAGVLAVEKDAVVLRERIALVHDQVSKKVTTPDIGLAELLAAGIPRGNAELIVAAAAALAKIAWP
jgi:hypothetical protein